MQRFTWMLCLLAGFALAMGACKKSDEEGAVPRAQKAVEGAGEGLLEGAESLTPDGDEPAEGEEGAIDDTAGGLEGDEADPAAAGDEPFGDDPAAGETGDEMAGDTGSAAIAGGVDTEAIGVAECDDYYEKHLACINENVPEAERESMLNALNEKRAEWGEQTLDDDAKAELAKTCVGLLEDAKRDTEEYGCEF